MSLDYIDLGGTGNLLDSNKCIYCKEEMKIQRPDGLPLHSQCEHKIRKQAYELKMRKKRGEKVRDRPQPHFVATKYVPPQGG